MDKRHFTVVIGSKEHGLYVSSKPSSAAKKAVSKLCASNKSKKVEFSLREITQGSKKKTYGPYLGEMKKLKKPIELKGRVIRHEIKVHLKKEKHLKTSKKMRGGEEKDFFNNLRGHQSDMLFPVGNASILEERRIRKLKESINRLEDAKKKMKPSNEELNNNNNNSQEFYSFDEKYRSIFNDGIRLYNSNNFNAAFPLLKEAADKGGIPLAATKVATYYLDHSYLSTWSFKSAINCTYVMRSTISTNNSTLSSNKRYKRIVGIAYLFLALARYNEENEILCMINPQSIKTALFKVFGINDKAVKERIKMIKKSEDGWKIYVKESILDVIEEHKLSPTLMIKK
jgi:hypothetical protein